MFALAVSQVHVELTPVSGAPLVLQARAPIGKTSGPVDGELLSRPTTSQVMGVTVIPAAWAPGAASRKPANVRASRSLRPQGKRIAPYSADWLVPLNIGLYHAASGASDAQGLSAQPA